MMLIVISLTEIVYFDGSFFTNAIFFIKYKNWSRNLDFKKMTFTYNFFKVTLQKKTAK